MDKEKIDEIKKDVEKIFNERVVHSIILFGSYATGEETSRSDVDICIVAPSLRDDKKLAFKTLLKLGAKLPPKYDVFMFELLPLYMKIEVIEKGIVLMTRDKSELFEYFRLYRRIWKDQEKRQRIGKDYAKIFS